MARESAPSDAGTPQRIRLDVWLDVACVCKTRSAARQACLGGKVSVNGTRAKPHREIGAGDRINITTASGRRRELAVRGVAPRHVPKTEAQALYEDVTPPPTPEEVELRELLQLAGPARGSRPGAPDRRDRRLLRRSARDRL